MTDEVPSLAEWFELKDERRTGWVLREVDSPESVAGHSWGVATLCLLYAERAGIDREKAVAMALVHDIGEARVGDIPMRAEDGDRPVPEGEKEAAEREAVIDLTAPFGDEEIHALWEEFEAGETPAATFVQDMDQIDSCLQALKYERQSRYDEDKVNEQFTEHDNLDEFFATAAGEIRTGVAEDLFRRITAEYEQEIGRECQL